MKPIKLSIEGVNSFIEEQTLDFEAAGRSNLFCISGKTGAGKSTIFDSIMLALYGKSPKGDLADVVNLSVNTARVKLEFEEKGEIYVVERVIKRRKDKDGKQTASSDCTLYKNGAPISVKSGDINSIIYDIIGLEAAEFKNVYLLEQGEYAEFLKKTPQKQTEAVGKIFSLMRFWDLFRAASDKERDLNKDIEALQRDLDRLGDVSPQALKEKKDEMKSLKSRFALLEKEAATRAAELIELEKVRDVYIAVREKQNAVKTLMLQSDEAKKHAYEAKTALEEFERSVDPEDGKKQEALREKLNSLSALNMLDREYAACVREIAAKQDAFNKKDEQLKTAKNKLTELEKKLAEDEQKRQDKIGLCFSAVSRKAKKSGGLEFVYSVLNKEEKGASEIAEGKQKLIAELDRLEELSAARNKAAQAISDYTDSRTKQLAVIEQYNRRLNELAENVKLLEAEVEIKTAALSSAQLHSHAAAVRAELHNGDTCPVCGGKYDGTHESGDSDVARAKADLENAKKLLKEAEALRAECDKHMGRAKADYDNLDKSINSAENELKEIEQKMEALCVEVEPTKNIIKLLDECKEAFEAVEKSEAAIAKHTPVVSALEAERSGLVSALEELSKKAEEYKVQLGEYCGKTDGEIEKIKQDLAEVEKRLGEVDIRRKQLSGEAQARAAAVQAIETSLSAAQADCPVDIPEFDEEGYAQKRDEAERIKNQVADCNKDIAVKQVEVDALNKKCEELNSLKAELATVKKRADLYHVIVDMTRNKAMLNFVATEFIVEFTAVASEILSEMSSGKYTMTYDRVNGFMVSDYLNGNKFRKTDTLSGGELFLASLSVAIAIARTQSRGNNAFFFLDEGFGTLDEDLIDVVYGALESLSSDCLVGVITHAEALIARMPYTVTVHAATDSQGSRIQN